MKDSQHLTVAILLSCALTIFFAALTMYFVFAFPAAMQALEKVSGTACLLLNYVTPIK